MYGRNFETARGRHRAVLNGARSLARSLSHPHSKELIRGRVPARFTTNIDAQSNRRALELKKGTAGEVGSGKTVQSIGRILVQNFSLGPVAIFTRDLSNIARRSPESCETARTACLALLPSYERASVCRVGLRQNDRAVICCTDRWE